MSDVDAPSPAAPAAAAGAAAPLLLVKFPTRGRPVRFQRQLEAYMRTRRSTGRVQFLITIDEDDETMNTPGAIEWLSGFPDVTVGVGLSGSKVAAINRDMHLAPSDWTHLLLASDDMAPQAGWDATIMSDFARFEPDRVLWYFDGHATELNTIVCCDRAYYERFGFIYDPVYKSLWCDNEFQEVAEKLGRQVKLSTMILRHDHPLHGTVPTDATYDANEVAAPEDLRTYCHRREYPYHLSILICSLTSRARLLSRLHSNLLHQADRVAPTGFKVQILISQDNGRKTVGAKRNELLKEAAGRYCCFVDDDDDLAPDTLAIWAPILQENKADVLELHGAYFVDGLLESRFHHSIIHSAWEKKDGVYVRPPNHLNPTLTGVMKVVGFPPISYGEDSSYSLQAAKMRALSIQAPVPQLVYYYYKERPPAAAPPAPPALPLAAAKKPVMAVKRLR